MLFILVTIFILLHIPFTVLIFMRTKLLKNAIMNQLEGGFYLLSCISHICLYLNAAVNPIIYGLTNDNFRRAYHQTPIIPKHFGRLLHTLKQFKYKVCPMKIYYGSAFFHGIYARHHKIIIYFIWLVLTRDIWQRRKMSTSIRLFIV